MIDPSQYKEVNPFESSSGGGGANNFVTPHMDDNQYLLSQESSAGKGGFAGGTSTSNYTINEDSKEEDVSFNARRSNIFGGVSSPIQRAADMNNVGSEDRAPSSILRGMV